MSGITGTLVALTFLFVRTMAVDEGGATAGDHPGCRAEGICEGAVTAAVERPVDGLALRPPAYGVRTWT